MKKKLLLLTPLMLGLMLSACGTSDTPTPTPSSEASSAETTSNEQTSNAQGTSSTAQSSSAAGQTSSAEATSSAEEWSSYEEDSSAEEETSSQEEASSSQEQSSSQATVRYTITFDSNEGSEVASITEDANTSVAKPKDPTRDGYNFTGWSYDEDGEEEVSWPITLTSDLTLYANWNEKVNFKDCLKTLMSVLKQDPYSFIPEAMRDDYSDNYVSEESVTYDFSSFNNVSNIKYGGFGEQWNMVLENIKESENFYKVLTIGETLINASVVLFNNYLDNNPGDTASHELKETEYTAKLDCSNIEIDYSIRYKTNMTIPFFGEVTPQVDMSYELISGLRNVRIQLNDNNALKYSVGEGCYAFGISYGVSTVSRKAYFEINDNEGEIEGHIYEFVQYKDKDLVPSAADFYIDEDYVSVVGNKAKGIVGFTGYINELYKADEGKLLGYKVRESFSKWGVNKTYNTLWFNLNNITGINSVKAVSNGGVDSHENSYDIYLNGSGTKFEPKRNSILTVKTSRRYDVEMRKQFFYGLDGENNIVKYEVNVPMMFIQDNGTESGETNYSTFESDIQTTNGITASVNLNSTYLEKIRADYLELIDIFIENKEAFSGDYIDTFIGDPAELDK